MKKAERSSRPGIGADVLAALGQAFRNDSTDRSPDLGIRQFLFREFIGGRRS